MNDLPDINVWLALIDKRHVHHGATSLYWADASVQSRAFCGTHKSAHGPPQDPAKQRSSVHTNATPLIAAYARQMCVNGILTTNISAIYMPRANRAVACKVLHPYQGIAIYSPLDFLHCVARSSEGD